MRLGMLVVTLLLCIGLQGCETWNALGEDSKIIWNGFIEKDVDKDNWYYRTNKWTEDNLW